MANQASEFSAAEWLEQAQEAEDSDNTKTALEAVENALKLDPSLAEAWRLKASLLQDMDRPQDAFKTLNEACQRMPHNASLWFDTGAFLVAHQEIVQALHCFIRVHELDANYPRIKSNLGQTFLSIGDFENAAKLLEEAIEESNGDIDKARLYKRLGEANLGLKDLDKAFDCFDKSLMLYDKDAVVLANMAMVHMQREEFEPALQTIDSAISLAPKDPNLKVMLAAILDSRKETAKADAAIEEAIKLAPNDPELWIKIANRYIHKGDTFKAIECLDNAVKAAPNSYQVWHSKAFLLMQLDGHENQALECFDKSIELNPQFPGNWLLKSQLLYRMERVEEATACHRRGLHLSGNLVIWGLFLIDEENKPVENTNVAIETERSIPQNKVAEQYVKKLKADGHEISPQGIVDGKYRIAMTQLPLEAIQHGPEDARNQGSAAPHEGKPTAKPEDASKDASAKEDASKTEG